MSDVEINLYDASRTDGPLATLEADYQDLAKMDNRTFVGKCKTAFSFDLTEERMVLEIDEPGNRICRSWQPLRDDQDQMEHELEIQLDHLIREWRG